jgi:hypothetical protein
MLGYECGDTIARASDVPRFEHQTKTSVKGRGTGESPLFDTLAGLRHEETAC